MSKSLYVTTVVIAQERTSEHDLNTLMRFDLAAAHQLYDKHPSSYSSKSIQATKLDDAAATYLDMSSMLRKHLSEHPRAHTAAASRCAKLLCTDNPHSQETQTGGKKQTYEDTHQHCSTNDCTL